jgi:hypothetical protein
LRNAASEPHVQDLAHFLVALGARIEGIGTNTIVVHGPATLGGARYAIQPDHIEVGSLIGLAAVTRSPLRIARAGVEHLRSIRMGFERLGIVCGVEGDDLVVPSGQTMKIHDDFGGHVPKLEDQPWPAFPADLMSIAIVTATQCDGVILMFEKMFEVADVLCRQADLDGRPHRAVRSAPGDRGRAEPAARRADDLPDIRAGMAMLLAAVAAEGTSTINNADQIERGYERIEERLNALGARITRVPARDGRWAARRFCLASTPNRSTPRRMLTGALRHHHNQTDDQHHEHGRCVEATDRQAPSLDRRVEKVADGSAERSGQDECAPEQQRAGNIGEEIRRRDQHQRRTEHQRTALIAKAIGIGHPVAERRAQGLREQDGGPVERFNPGRSYRVHRNRSSPPVPDAE